jgi:hypothetical protein
MRRLRSSIKGRWSFCSGIPGSTVPRLLLISVIFFGSELVAQAQKDVCHVYVVDSGLAERSYNARTTAEENRIAARAQTTFPEFRPTIAEEELTTKTYRFPRSRLMITASVFYTDESMATKETVESIIVGVVVSGRRLREALSAPNNAVAETSYTGKPFAVRAKKWLWVNRRRYVVGIECRNVEKTEPKLN